MNDETNIADWKQFIFDPEQGIYERLKRSARRRFPDPTLSEEAFNYAFDALFADDARRLRQYQGRSSKGSYLTVVFRNLLEGFAHKRFGKPRPPAWIKRLGSPWTEIYDLLCAKRRPPESVVDYLGSRGDWSAETLRAMVRQVGAQVVNCGGATMEQVDLDPEFVQHDGGTPEHSLGAQHVQAIYAVLAGLIDGQEPGAHISGVEQLSNHWQSLKDCLAGLADADRILLKLIFGKGYSVAAAARALNAPERQTGRRRDRALRFVKDCLSVLEPNFFY